MQTFEGASAKIYWFIFEQTRGFDLYLMDRWFYSGEIMNENKIGLSIYVTHSGHVTIKMASKTFAQCQSELPVLASYDHEKYTLLNKDFFNLKGHCLFK